MVPEPPRRDRGPWRARLLALGALGAFVIVFLLIVTGGGGSSRHPQTNAQQTTGTHATTPAHRHVGAFRVGRLTLSVVEPASASTADGKTSSGAPARLLTTSVRYPALGTPNGKENPHASPAASSGPFPLIVFSQGYDTEDSAYAYLMDQWASAGYVVAAPTYPHTSPSSPSGPIESDIVNHPADLRFAIRSLLAQTSAPLKGLIDTSKVAVIGHSDGGDVSLAVAANSCCRDSAVKAAVILSGGELARFGGSYYSSGSVPLLAVQGSADTINSPGCGAQLYDGAPNPKYYLDLIGASHLTPYTLPGSDRTVVAKATLAFLDHYLKGQTLALSQAANVPGVARLITGSSIPGASTSCPTEP